jgi:hypothetical protein
MRKMRLKKLFATPSSEYPGRGSTVSRAIRANSDMQSYGASLSGQSDDYFAAYVFRGVDVGCLIMR